MFLRKIIAKIFPIADDKIKKVACEDGKTKIVIEDEKIKNKPKTEIKEEQKK